MPRRNRFFLKALLPLGLLVVAALALVRRGGDDWEYEQRDEPAEDASEVKIAAQHSRGRGARFALAAGFTTLFFAGASFTAIAGDQLTRLADDDAASLAAAEPAPVEAPPAEAPSEAVPAAEPVAVEPSVEPAVEPAAAPESVPEAAGPEATSSETAAPVNAAAAAEATLQPEATPTAPAASNIVAPAPATPSAKAETSTAAAAPAAAVRPAAPRTATKQWVVKRAETTPAVEPEIEHDVGEPTIWLNRALPDPTPASARLARSFAKDLVAVSKRHGANWAAVLGVLRAQGERGAVPATTDQLDALASRLGHTDTWKCAHAISGRTSFADRAESLADLYRAVGIEAHVIGLEASKAHLTEKLLADSRVMIYDSGRSDLNSGRVDVRIIVLLGYLAERHGSVTVSSLFSGHRRFARPGVVSAHIYGHAVDIAAVGDIAIAGHQQPGSITEAAVRSVLLLPTEHQPQQVISQIGLGGPSFPLRDHDDHIHVGY
jgi:outer membrane biosynthesis protein TonB